MKAITIREPWAWLIAKGIKDIENRTWPTRFRGRVLIHASKTCEKQGWGALSDEQRFRLVNTEAYRLSPSELPYGAIVGSVEIVDCVINHPSVWAEKTKTEGIKAGDIVPYKNTAGNVKNAEISSFTTVESGKVWFNGVDTMTKAKVWYSAQKSLELMNCGITYNWVLAHPILFEKPIPAKGQLGFWEFPNILAEPEEEGGKLFCHCQLPVKLENQVMSLGDGNHRCCYCGGIWYR